MKTQTFNHKTNNNQQIIKRDIPEPIPLILKCEFN